jgi:hypothetical protein
LLSYFRDLVHVFRELLGHRLQLLLLVFELRVFLRLLFVLVLDPVVTVVEIVPGDDEELSEEALQILIVRSLSEAELLNVFEKGHKLFRDALAELFEWKRALDLLDHVILFVFRDRLAFVVLLRLEALPGELALEVVDERVPDGLEVVSTGLLDPLVGVHRAVSGRSDEPLAVDQGDVLSRLALEVLREPEVDEVKVLSRLPEADDEILRLDITVNDVLIVEGLHSGDGLLGEHEDRFHL